MGVRVLHDVNHDMACMYSSSTDWAFGPIFYDENGHDAEERIEAFCRWLVRDPRELSELELSGKYLEWRAQEEEQWKREEQVSEYE
jgi:hypothetical protein